MGMDGLTPRAGAPDKEEESQHIGQRDPAWPRTASPARSPQPQQSPRRRAAGILAPRPSAPQRPAFPRGCGVSAGGRAGSALHWRSQPVPPRAGSARPVRSPRVGTAESRAGGASCKPTGPLHPKQRRDSAFWETGRRGAHGRRAGGDAAFHARLLPLRAILAFKAGQTLGGRGLWSCSSRRTCCSRCFR